MSRFNTGNPIDSDDPRDRSDNTKNLDQALNNQADTWTDRLGVTRPTIAAAIDPTGLAQSAVDAKVAAEAARDAALAGANTYASVSAGLASGDAQFNVVEGDDIVRYQNAAGEAAELFRFTTSRYTQRLITGDSLGLLSAGNTVWDYPYTDYHLRDWALCAVDYARNLIRYEESGLVVSLIKEDVTLTMYPLMAYADKREPTVVDAAGNVISQSSLRQFFGQPCLYPYTSYQELYKFVVVDAMDNIVEVKSTEGESIDFASVGKLYVEVDGALPELRVAWPHGDNQLMRVTYRPNGKNQVFNWLRTELADGTDIRLAQWVSLQSSNSDCWPPLVVEALANGDGGSPIYTGGNHGSDGGAGGVETAVMDYATIYVDGRRVAKGEQMATFADHVSVEWSNRLMAYNTITIPRYVLRQNFHMDVYPGDVSAFCGVVALEDIRVNTDNGPQMFSGGYSTLLFYDGELQERIPLPEGSLSSGAHTDYDAWAMVLGDPENGFHGAWVDKDFGAGDGRYVGGSAGYFRKGSGVKLYSNIVGGGGAGATLLADERYEWHGGYFWSPAEYAADLDSAFIFHKRRKPHLGWAATAATDGQIRVPVWVRGYEIQSLGVAGVAGVPFQSAGYTTSQNKLEN